MALSDTKSTQSKLWDIYLRFSPLIFRLLIILLPVIVVSPYFKGVNVDEENFPDAVISTIHQVRALFNGQFPLWNPNLGFGIPHPSAQHLIYHPLFLLWELLPVRQALIVFLIFHFGLAIYFLNKLCKYFGIEGRWVKFLIFFTFCLSNSTVSQLYTRFWFMATEVYTLYPVLLYFSLKFLDSHSVKKKWMYSISLGFFSGVALSGLPGTAPAVCLVASLPFLWRWRDAWKRAPYLIVSGLIMAGFLIDDFFLLNHERFMFPSQRGRVPQAPLGLFEYLKVLFFYQVWNVNAGGPIDFFPYIGTFFAGLAVYFLRGKQFLSENVYFLKRALILSFLFLNINFQYVTSVVSGSVTFKDGFHLYAILAAGFALDYLLRSKIKKWVYALLCLLGLLHVAQLSYLSYSKGEWWSHSSPDANIFNRSKLYQYISSREDGDKGKVILSPKMAKTTSSLDYLEWDLTENLNYYEGIQVVAGIEFKGTSLDHFSPYGLRLMYSKLESLPYLYESHDRMNILGIKYVVANNLIAEEFPKYLRKVGYYLYPFEQQAGVYENAEAWPLAVLMNDEIENLELKRDESCPHDRFLCMNFSPVSHLRKNGPDIKAEFMDGNIILITSEPMREEGWIMLSHQYRPGWEAKNVDDRVLDVKPLLKNFIGIHALPGVQYITLKYQPKDRLIYNRIAWFTFLTSYFLVILFSLKKLRATSVAEDSKSIG